MQPWLIALLVICCLILSAALWLTVSLEVLPRLAAKRLRRGSELNGDILYPEHYEELQVRVSVQKDLVYPSRYPANKFNLYLPKERFESNGQADGKLLPLLVWVHGGAFVAGNKEGTENVMTALCAAGYAVASIDYAVAPEHRYPAAVRQIDDFFAHLAEIGRRCPALDTSRIVFCGDSAGAQLAAQYAAVQCDAPLAEKMHMAPRLKERLKALMLISGPYDLPALRAYAKAHDKKLLFLVDLWGKAYFGKLFWHKSKAAKQTVISAHLQKSFPPVFLTDGNEGSFEAQNRRLAKPFAPARSPSSISTERTVPSPTTISSASNYPVPAKA